MLYQKEIDQHAQEIFPSKDMSHWRAPSSGNRLDCETGILLRRTLHSDFNTATCWKSLSRLLNDRGFGLGFRDGRLMLMETSTDRSICSCRFLGWPLTDLAARFGKLRARPSAGSSQAQIIC